jgi:hypothetical protein
MSFKIKYHRDASKRLLFDDDKIPVNLYKEVVGRIKSEFVLKPLGKVISNGYDVAFRDYASGTMVVGLEWDNWSGFIVVAKSPESEPLVRSIGDWFERIRPELIVQE